MFKEKENKKWDSVETDSKKGMLKKIVAPVVTSKGPKIDAGNGTTAELKLELARLKGEQSKIKQEFIYVDDMAGGYYDYPHEYYEYSASISKLEGRIAERGSPDIENSTVTMDFDGTNLTIRAGGNSKSFPAVSGHKVDGKFDYSVERQKEENQGPIPEGSYWINPSELKNLYYYVLWPSKADAWGPFRITIHPYDSAKTFGRGGFFIHGGTVPGSAGCIDLTSNMLALSVLLMSDSLSNKYIDLNVTYPK